jgi:hypothetical protein
LEKRAVAQRNDLPEEPGQDIAASPTGAELRAAPRFTLLIRAAKLIVDGREFLCILRDASATGVKIRLFTPIPEHKSLAIELGTGERHEARLVWTTGDHAGLQFLEEIDVQRLLDEREGLIPAARCACAWCSMPCSIPAARTSTCSSTTFRSRAPASNAKSG